MTVPELLDRLAADLADARSEVERLRAEWVAAPMSRECYLALARAQAHEEVLMQEQNLVRAGHDLVQAQTGLERALGAAAALDRKG